MTLNAKELLNELRERFTYSEANQDICRQLSMIENFIDNNPGQITRDIIVLNILNQNALVLDADTVSVALLIGKRFGRKISYGSIEEYNKKVQNLYERAKNRDIETPELKQALMANILADYQLERDAEKETQPSFAFLSKWSEVLSAAKFKLTKGQSNEPQLEKLFLNTALKVDHEFKIYKAKYYPVKPSLR